MKPLYICGFASISSAGMRPGAHAQRVGAGTAQHHPGVPVAALYEAELPCATGHALTDFDVRAQLGRKGTSFYDRATALAVVACGQALQDAEITIDDQTRAGVGIALGTTVGSFKSTSDYSMETLIQPKPYLVNPVLFPNTVMNCAAGQAAIRHGLKGINATVTGGPVAFLNALRYAGNAISQGYADTMLVGAVEEFTPHRAWMSALSPATSAGAGEAAAIFAVSRARRGPLAEILGMATGFGPSGFAAADTPGNAQGTASRNGAATALAACVSRALRTAGVTAESIALHVSGDHAAAGDIESDPVSGTLGCEPPRLLPAQHFGDCGAATPAVGLAALLDLHQAQPHRDGQVSLLTASTSEGAVGAVIVRGWSRGGTDRG